MGRVMDCFSGGPVALDDVTGPPVPPRPRPHFLLPSVMQPFPLARLRGVACSSSGATATGGFPKGQDSDKNLRS